MKLFRTPTAVLLLTLIVRSVSAVDLYVSPLGNDGNAGDINSPVLTLGKAKSLARQRARQEPVTVRIADGVYYLPETLVFGPEDSGSKEHPILFVANHEGRAILSGGTKLSLAWQPYRDGIYMAKTPAGLVIDQLFVDGLNQRMARYPNYDASKKTEAYQGFAADAFAKERAARWVNPKGGYIHAMHRMRWGGYHYQITGKDSKGEVTYEGGWQNNRKMGMHNEYRMVENIFEELDAPGEWFHNSETSTLYYMPASGVDLAKAVVEVVRLKHLIEFQGSQESPVRNVTLKGFTVRHAARTFMETKEQMLRSDWAIYRGGAFMLTGTEDIHIDDCEFDQVGGNAIFVNNYNRGTVVKGTHIHDTGASGVCFVGDSNAVRDPLFEYGQKNDLDKIDRTPGPKSQNFPSLGIVEDCLIHGIGRVERQPAGVQMEMSQEITVRDCSIYDCARAGINIGDGAWGGHLIERCDVFDTVLETHDHGSFNSWGRDRYWRSDQPVSQKAVDADPKLPFLDAVKTTTIRDSRWRCDHGWDIDLDDGSSNYDIYNNLLLNTGLKLREGFRRHAWNNVIPIGSLHPHVWYDGSKDQVYANIFAMAHRPARMSTPYVNGTMVDRNLFTTQDPNVLKTSKQLGWDENTVLGDPMYVDPANGDFRVKDGSPALKLGFKNFPMDQFGVKKASLKAIAEKPVIPDLKTEQKIERKSAAPAKTSQPAKLDPVWLGATLHSIEGEEFSAFGTNKEDGGIALTKVPKSSAAENAGLRENDLIQAIDGKPVATVEQLFKELSKTKSASVKLKVIRDQQTREVTVERQVIVEIESSSSANGFKKLALPLASTSVITTNQKTNNDPIRTLTDGKLDQEYGPIFANGIRDGAYKMDLGSSKAIVAVTSWSFTKNGMRGSQKLTVYGSSASSDPGWDLSKYTPLGTIDAGVSKDKFIAASLQALDGKTLGDFRWIVWAVLPVSDADENTAFQELAVEVEAIDSITPAMFPGKRSDFHGYDCFEFRIHDRIGVKIISPKKVAPGKPWLWRNIFWEAIKPVYLADLQLVEEGYHVVVVHGDVSGHPNGNANIDSVYDLVTSEYGFAKKCSAYSMSRGNLQVFQWAAANPEKVSSICVDNGVSNIRSWPAGSVVPGNDSKAPGAPDSWALFKKVYGYATDAEALASKETPIEKLEPLAKAGVPILVVCGSKDTAVPYEENDAILEQRYKALGGDIRVIIEDKGHTHGMKEPTPVLEFIRKHTSTSAN